MFAVIKSTFAFVGRLGHSAYHRTARLGLVAGLIAVIFVSSLGPATAAPSEETSAAQTYVELTDDGTLVIFWYGDVEPGMAEFLQETFVKYADQAQRVELILNSPGGLVYEGERVIHVLQQIKRTHELTTAVLHGSTCSSMCIPIYMQGDKRYAAGATIWVFHEMAAEGEDGKYQILREETLLQYGEIFLTAGVSRQWVYMVLEQIRNTDFYQTGDDLFAAGVVTHLLGDGRQRREIEA